MADEEEPAQHVRSRADVATTRPTGTARAAATRRRKSGPPATLPSDAGALAELVNLGPKSAAMLAAAGIGTVGQLRQLGSVAAYARVRRIDRRASLNLLWALEGALTGLPWQVVAREHRTSLLLALEAYES